MKVKETVYISAPVTTVWDLLSDPATQAEWHPQFVSLDRQRTGPVLFRERFQMTGKLSDDPLRFAIEVIACEPPHRLGYRYTANTVRGAQVMELQFELIPDGQGVTLKHVNDLSGANLPWWLRAVMWIAFRFGRQEGQSALEGLKEYAEGRKSARPPTQAT